MKPTAHNNGKLLIICPFSFIVFTVISAFIANAIGVLWLPESTRGHNLVTLIAMDVNTMIIIVFFEVIYFWYVIAVFSYWSTYYPPRTLRAYAAFLVTTIAAGVWVTYWREAIKEPGEPDFVPLPFEWHLGPTLVTCIVVTTSAFLTLQVTKLLLRL